VKHSKYNFGFCLIEGRPFQIARHEFCLGWLRSFENAGKHEPLAWENWATTPCFFEVKYVPLPYLLGIAQLVDHKTSYCQ